MQNCINCTISDNTITNCPRGITIYNTRNYGEGNFLASTIANAGGIATTISSDYIKPSQDQNITIKITPFPALVMILSTPAMNEPVSFLPDIAVLPQPPLYLVIFSQQEIIMSVVFLFATIPFPHLNMVLFYKTQKILPFYLTLFLLTATTLSLAYI